MEFLRPIVAPVIFCLLLSILWVMGSMKQMSDQIRRAERPTARAAFVAQNSFDDAD